jgi:hypothetical protein
MAPMKAVVLALMLAAIVTAPSLADVQWCPLYQDGAVPTHGRALRQCRRLGAMCARLCRKYPGMGVCTGCWQPGGPCATPLPTPAECCAAGYEVQGGCPDTCAQAYGVCLKITDPTCPRITCSADATDPLHVVCAPVEAIVVCPATP